MTSQTISLSAAAEKEKSSLSENPRQILCKITASQTKEGVKQSETLVGEQCVRHTV